MIQDVSFTATPSAAALPCRKPTPASMSCECTTVPSTSLWYLFHITPLLRHYLLFALPFSAIQSELLKETFPCFFIGNWQTEISNTWSVPLNIIRSSFHPRVSTRVLNWTVLECSAHQTSHPLFPPSLPHIHIRNLQRCISYLCCVCPSICPQATAGQLAEQLVTLHRIFTCIRAETCSVLPVFMIYVFAAGTGVL
jgi:hypothetical protein